MQLAKKFLVDTEYKNFDISIASADASFRSYFRITKDSTSLILMDSSREKESLKPFIDISSKLAAVGVSVPQIYYQDLNKGFLVIEDFGSVDLLSSLNDQNFKSFYKEVISEIVKIQKVDSKNLPPYDKNFLLQEMSLMKKWFLGKYLKISDFDEIMIDKTLNVIYQEVLKQPQNCFVHRDLHSRNIMVMGGDRIGIIDYQDAMSGGITYDLVSLLRDLYIRYEPSDIEELALQFRDLTCPDVEDETFMRWFDFTGLQRHIKVLGIFARLYLRDDKDDYLQHLPLTMQYILETTSKYEETKDLHHFLSKLELK